MELSGEREEIKIVMLKTWNLVSNPNLLHVYYETSIHTLDEMKKRFFADDLP